MWTDFEEIQKLGFFEQVSRLLAVYQMFYDVYINLDVMFNDTAIMAYPQRIVDKLADVS